ncbi:alpha/beta hydrolase [Myroides ceti]|uniref:Alpha/beta hydrolase n=1 Tax=Paenimyroides ceti TaxID=395087 RepID=A0ABT8CZ72_9FLAO|nr:alpha/beta hydrolase [Paenimyroides ceti]MDN3707187.1 alpha/beta hydrolase [Paenimyroides ceti]MDN3709595.1 alpha/beta hydrolase [Paenimyroides ceti]MDN3709607.1 alpha/beta hydrolase [Paenimyroides ceti]MDN3710166.1 alpha/beta hydrolase [Paenimyroides ceti]
MAHTNIPAHQDPEISKDIREFLKELNNEGGKPMEEMTPEEARQVLIDAQKSVDFDYSDIEESERTITQDGLTVNIHIVKPAGSGTNLPVFMFFHGGGWVLGDYPTHKRLVRDLVVNSGAIAVFPDYTPSPEAQYPVAVNEAYAATKWVAENGKEIGVDGSRLAVAGNSVGGNMATVVALMAKDKMGPEIAYQVLLWPVTDADFTRESYIKYAQDRFLTTPMMKWMWNHYTTDLNKRKEKYASPLQATLQELKNLPPALVQIAENDILHDEGLAYARKLDEAGVPTTITVYKGFIHDYGMLNPLAHIPAVQTSVHQASIALKKALNPE